jgi:hypothetical protein
MSGTGPRQRAAIALSFGVQAVLMAAALALPAELSSTAGVSSSSAVAVPAPVTLLPVVAPLDNGVPPGPSIPVMVQVGAERGTWDPVSGPLVFLIESGQDVTATVTIVLPDGHSAYSLSLGLADEGPLPNPPPGLPAAGRSRLSVPALGQGTHTFTLHLGNLAPHSGTDIVMTLTQPGDQSAVSSVIAEIVTG